MLNSKIEIISQLFKSTNVKFENEKAFEIFNDINNKIYLNTNSIEFDEDSNTLTLKLKEFLGIPILSFPNPEKYFNSTYINGKFVIFDIQGDFCLFSDNLISFNSSVNSKFKIVCNNLVGYYRMYNFLKSENFCDHFNDSSNEIVIYNSASGIFRINYSPLPNLDQTNDRSIEINELIEFAQKTELSMYFKNTLFELSNKTGTIALEKLIEDAKIALQIAKRNYEIAWKIPST